MTEPFVSVIIPTYNRAESLRRTLDSLALQTYPMDRFEVIVVDDGSTDDTRTIGEERFPFKLRYFRQSNQGAVVARNLGVQHSSAEVLVFLDDDVIVEPNFVSCLAKEHGQYDRAILMGAFRPYVTGQDPPFRAIWASTMAPRGHGEGAESASFTECVSHNMSLRREHFFAIGRFQYPSRGGWPGWDDIDLAYRAHMLGFAFIRVAGAVGCHIDHALDDLATSYERAYRAGRSAVALFGKHPDLRPHLPMFRDKTPILLRSDPPRLILRKAARAVTAWRPLLWGMEQLVHFLERVAPRPALLRPLYRWILSSYIYRGYRQGLREHGPVEARP